MKENHQRPSGPSEVKILSEREIQSKLYGGYLSRRLPESQWTGSEILTQELERLRTELISLRQEKEKLATTLSRLKPRQEVVHHAPVPSAAGWLGKLAAAALVLAAGGYVVNDRLQALPATGDPTPFTVQAAVYDTQVPAQLAVQFLEGLSYGAFVVEVPRKKDGRVRYRVCVGSYVTKDEADMERLRLVGDPRFGYFKDAFVRLR